MLRTLPGILLLLSPAALSAQTALPRSPTEMGGLPADKLPEELKGASVSEKLGDKVPTDLFFRDEYGQDVTFGKLLGDGLPTILTFNYSNCPVLCSVQLGGLVETLRQMAWKAGLQFRVVTVGLDPTETPTRTRETKKKYLERYRVESAEKGWRFVAGDAKTVRALADAVGYGYKFVEERNEYAHPAVLTFLSPSGVITHYLYGVQYDATAVSKAIAGAVLGRPEENPEKFILACFHYTPSEGNSNTARELMRYGGMAFLAVLLGVFVWALRRRRASALREAKP